MSEEHCHLGAVQAHAVRTGVGVCDRAAIYSYERAERAGVHCHLRGGASIAQAHAVCTSKGVCDIQ